MRVTPQTTGRVLKRAQYRNHRAADRALAAIGTTLVQWDALRAIDEAPSSSAHALAVATFQSDQSFGTLAARLVAQDLIERAPGRGRRVEHRLTDAGKRMLAAGQAVTAEVTARSFAELSAAELGTLHALLERVGVPVD
ncbi:MarR family winged helix-turn-helix transcriptional regulator [Gryllotalpicola protaetiae]|uniref:MarR family transcriptional regulator n=1 Tax=Gryllotalpicola protaetiae TaxID=2419771 RepID=A0A387BG37_9MICO|nr:MarR family winged helix-turn-helix transcriptional regulator [Gryllotalpicola protaetiae]AYG02893.1 MarR family transcriptional regulator [Gryllotalpicola protaetiae]